LAYQCDFFVLSQRLTTHFWSLCRLLFFVSGGGGGGGGVELFQTALQTHTIDRSVLSSLLIGSRDQSLSREGL
jgi:hypothetical protein